MCYRYCLLTRHHFETYPATRIVVNDLLVAAKVWNVAVSGVILQVGFGNVIVHWDLFADDFL